MIELFTRKNIFIGFAGFIGVGLIWGWILRKRMGPEDMAWTPTNNDR